MQKSLEGGGDEPPNELGFLFDQIVMDDDAVADRRDAAIGIPEDSRLGAAADLHARDLTERVASDGGDLPGDQRRRAAGGIDVDDANLAGVETAAAHEGRPL